MKLVGRNAADAANGFAINDAGNNAFEKGVFFRGGGGGVGVEQADEAGVQLIGGEINGALRNAGFDFGNGGIEGCASLSMERKSLFEHFYGISTLLHERLQAGNLRSQGGTLREESIERLPVGGCGGALGILGEFDGGTGDPATEGGENGGLDGGRVRLHGRAASCTAFEEGGLAAGGGKAKHNVAAFAADDEAGKRILEGLPFAYGDNITLFAGELDSIECIHVDDGGMAARE